MHTRNELLQLFKDGPAHLEQAIQRYPKDMWDYKPNPDTWSIHEMLHHLADSEAHGYIRIRTLIAENGASASPYNQAAWAQELQYSRQNPEEALALFRALRCLTADLLSQVSEHVWATHAIVHPEYGSVTLEDLLRSHTGHVEMHLQEMAQVHQAWQSRY